MRWYNDKKIWLLIRNVRRYYLYWQKSFNEIEDDALTLNNKLKKIKIMNYILGIVMEPVAYLGILYVSNLHYTGAWIDLIAVIEEARQQGIAKELIKFSRLS